MKNFFRLFLLLVLVALMLPVGVFAASSTPAYEPENIIRFEDGSYIIIELTSAETRASGTKTGTKTYTYYDNGGTEEWRAVLIGTFTYTGSSATCTASSCSVTITNTNWYEVSKTASKSGNTATAEVTMGRKWLGITVEKKTVPIQITCDANGNMS